MMDFERIEGLFWLSNYRNLDNSVWRDDHPILRQMEDEWYFNSTSKGTLLCDQRIPFRWHPALHGPPSRTNVVSAGV